MQKVSNKTKILDSEISDKNIARWYLQQKKNFIMKNKSKQ